MKKGVRLKVQQRCMDIKKAHGNSRLTLLQLHMKNRVCGHPVRLTDHPPPPCSHDLCAAYSVHATCKDWARCNTNIHLN